MREDYEIRSSYYALFVSKKDLNEILNHVFNHLIVCGEDFDKSPEFHKKKIIKDLDYSNMFSFKNFGLCIRLICEKNGYDKISFEHIEEFYSEGKESNNKDCMRIDIRIVEFTPFLFLTKKEKIDFNIFLKYFKKFNNFMLGSRIFEYKNDDVLINLDENISKVNYGYDSIERINNKLYENFFNMTFYFKCDEKELEKFFQNFFKDFKILSAYDFGTFEKIRIPKRFLKSSMRINFKFNKLPMYVEFYRCSKEDEFKNLETYFQIEFGFLFERDIREANEDRKKLFNKYFKELKKLSDDIVFRQEWNCEDYFKKTLFDENGFKIRGLKKN